MTDIIIEDLVSSHNHLAVDTAYHRYYDTLLAEDFAKLLQSLVDEVPALAEVTHSTIPTPEEAEAAENGYHVERFNEPTRDSHGDYQIIFLHENGKDTAEFAIILYYGDAQLPVIRLGN